MLKKIQEELCNIRKKPLNIAFSALTVTVMIVLTILAWDGITKRLVICLGLTAISGILLLMPELLNRVTVPLLAVYLFYVPVKIFQRMELPMQDMSRIVDGAEELTAALIICAYLLVFLLTQSSAAALGAGSGFFLILFLVEYYIWKFRGNFLMPGDLGAVGTAVSVMGNYDYALSPEAIYSVLYFLFFIVLGSRIRIRMHKGVHIGISAVAVLWTAVWYFVVMNVSDSWDMGLDYWNLGASRDLNGACMSYFFMVRDNRVDVPDGYSDRAVLDIAEQAAADYGSVQETEQKPDIIMIMNEAWSDLRVLGELEMTEAGMPFTDSLTDNTVRGNLYVSILGGLTANTEFEALTGNSLSFLAQAAIPYQNQVDHDMPSLARILKTQGYTAMAMHPNGEKAWNRGHVYSYFGFDSFIHEGVWEVPFETIRTFASDDCNYNEIIHRYENRDRDVPFFLFDVTIQNHSGYYGDVPMDINLTQVGDIPAEEVGYLYDADTYLNLIKISDDAFKKLLTYFEQVEEPVIICMFGDHQPLLGDDFYEAVFTGQELSEEEKNLKKYIVPYVIWANYEVDWKEYGDMSANYLPAVLTECAGLQMPPFYQYLLELRETYPVLTGSGCRDQEGNLVNIKDIWEEEKILRYRMLQYNQLYEEDYLSGVFEETAVGALE